jgi:sulfide:quinone oxidoreductase
MEYVHRYNAGLHFNHHLVRVDGPARTAWFEERDDQGTVRDVSVEFDMIHVCPPQTAPDFVRQSPLADADGWVDVDQNTLQHRRFHNVWSLGDAMNAPNAKTAAAARMQAPIVANNLLHDMGLVDGRLALQRLRFLPPHGGAWARSCWRSSATAASSCRASHAG